MQCFQWHVLCLWLCCYSSTANTHCKMCTWINHTSTHKKTLLQFLRSVLGKALENKILRNHKVSGPFPCSKYWFFKNALNKHSLSYLLQDPKNKFLFVLSCPHRRSSVVFFFFFPSCHTAFLKSPKSSKACSLIRMRSVLTRVIYSLFSMTVSLQKPLM